MIQEFLRRLMRVEGFDVGTPDPIDRAKAALAEAKARRLEMDDTDPRRLADLEIQQRADELTAAEHEAEQRQLDDLRRAMAEAIDLHRQALQLFQVKQGEASGALTELSRVEAVLDALQERIVHLDRARGASWQPSGALLWAQRNLMSAWARGQHNG